MQIDTTNPHHAILADFILFSQRELLLGLSKELNKDGISFAQFFLICFLATSEEKEITMTDIARKMGHSTAAATGLADRFEKLGLINRKNAANDRRKVMVSITEKGLDLVNRFRSKLEDMISVAMDEVGSQDAGSFLERFRKLD